MCDVIHTRHRVSIKCRYPVELLVAMHIQANLSSFGTTTMGEAYEIPPALYPAENMVVDMASDALEQHCQFGYGVLAVMFFQVCLETLAYSTTSSSNSLCH